MKEKKTGSIIEFILVSVLTALVVAVVGVLFGAKKTACPVEEKAVPAAVTEEAASSSASDEATQGKSAPAPSEASAK